MDISNKAKNRKLKLTVLMFVLTIALLLLSLLLKKNEFEMPKLIALRYLSVIFASISCIFGVFFANDYILLLNLERKLRDILNNFLSIFSIIAFFSFLILYINKLFTMEKKVLVEKGVVGNALIYIIESGKEDLKRTKIYYRNYFKTIETGYCGKDYYFDISDRNEYKIGDTIKIKYLPKNPDVFSITY